MRIFKQSFDTVIFGMAIFSPVLQLWLLPKLENYILGNSHFPWIIVYPRINVDKSG